MKNQFFILHLKYFKKSILTTNFPVFRFGSINNININKNYYKILNVNEKSTPSEIKKNFYLLAKKYHPDMNKGKEEQFKEINEAYEILGDDNKKKQYDDMRKYNNSSTSSNNAYSSNSYSQNYNNYYQSQNQGQKQQQSYYYYETRQGPKDFKNMKFNKMNQDEIRFNAGKNPNMNFHEEVFKEFMKDVYGKMHNSANTTNSRNRNSNTNANKNYNYSNNYNYTYNQRKNNEQNNYYQDYYDDEIQINESKRKEEIKRQMDYDKLQREKEVILLY